MKKAVPFILITVGCFAGLALGDALPINPGLWETTTVTNNPMTGQQTHTSTECMVDDEFDPASQMDGTENCEIIESVLEGDTLTYTMSCNMQGGQMTMHGVYQTDGNTGQGTMNMEMSFGGQTMTSEGSMTAVRLGEC